jgi:ATP-dependent DNA ligase
VPAVVPPIAPMLAKLARELPIGDDVVYEPKWDGFRCLAFVDADGTVDLRSRNDRPLARYFPEVVAALGAVAPVVLDGELVVATDGRADFAALMGRLHPASSRVERLAVETPAVFLAFDVLAVGDDDLRPRPYRERRPRLEAVLAEVPQPVVLSPATRDADLARAWLAAAPGSAIDGVVVKRAGDPYAPGKRALVKVKHERTADCVVAGFRLYGGEAAVGSLLLGLYDGDALRHVGVVTSFPRARRVELLGELAPLVVPVEAHPWRDGFALEGGPMGRLPGAAARWAPGMSLDWAPLRIERVAEVAYTQLDGIRFRHPALFRRWRPDRDPASCRIDQLVGAPVG